MKEQRLHDFARTEDSGAGQQAVDLPASASTGSTAPVWPSSARQIHSRRITRPCAGAGVSDSSGRSACMCSPANRKARSFNRTAEGIGRAGDGRRDGRQTLEAVRENISGAQDATPATARMRAELWSRPVQNYAGNRSLNPASTSPLAAAWC